MCHFWVDRIGWPNLSSWWLAHKLDRWLVNTSAHKMLHQKLLPQCHRSHPSSYPRCVFFATTLCARGSEWQPWIVAMHAFVLRTSCVHFDGLWPLWPLQIFSSFTIASRILEVLWNARFLLSLNSWRFRLLHHSGDEPKKNTSWPKKFQLGTPDFRIMLNH